MTTTFSKCTYGGAQVLGGAGEFIFNFANTTIAAAGEVNVNTEGAFAVGAYTEGNNLWTGMVCANPPCGVNYADSGCVFTEVSMGISLACWGPGQAALAPAGGLDSVACTGANLSVTSVDPPTPAPGSNGLTWNYLHGTLDLTYPAQVAATGGVGPAVTIHIDF